MNDHTITITAGNIQERNKRVRDLLSRGYMPIRFFEKETIGPTRQEVVYSSGSRERKRVMDGSDSKSYGVVLRRRGRHARASGFDSNI